MRRPRLTPTAEVAELLEQVRHFIPMTPSQMATACGTTQRLMTRRLKEEYFPPTYCRALREALLDLVDDFYDPTEPPPWVGSKHWAVAAQNMRYVLYQRINIVLPGPKAEHEDMRNL